LTILSSFIHTALYVAVTYSYKTSNDSTFYGGNGYDNSDKVSILLDAVLSVAVVKVSQRQMALVLLKMQCRQEVTPRSVACPVGRARRLAAWTGSVARSVTWGV
jgi:hypothetical protein